MVAAAEMAGELASAGGERGEVSGEASQEADVVEGVLSSWVFVVEGSVSLAVLSLVAAPSGVAEVSTCCWALGVGSLCC